MVVEIEVVLNDRPLTYVSNDSQDPEPLTPSHLLYGRHITKLPYEHVTDVQDGDYGDRSDMTKRARVLAHLLKHFRCRWRQEYLTSLQEFHKASGSNMQRVKIGDVVLIHNDGPRIHWKLTVIEKLSKGVIRSAEVRTNSGKTNRPIAKLYPLEVTDDSTTSIQSRATEVQNKTCSHEDSDRPPRRAAAERATRQITEWAKFLVPRRMSRIRIYINTYRSHG